MNVRHTALFAALVVSTGISPGHADSRLTLYPDGIALIQEKRTVSTHGEDTLRIDRVPASLRPETLQLSIDGKPAPGHRLLNRTANRQRLIEANLGNAVELVRIDPTSGRETRLDARLIGADGAAAIVESDDGIQVIDEESPWRIIYPATTAARFVVKPVLEALLPGGISDPADMHMRYLAGGLGWSVDYVAELSDDNRQLQLTAWTTLRNNTNLDFNNSRIALIAGELNRVARPQARMEMAKSMDVRMSMAAAPVPVAPQSGYHRYALPGVIDLKSGESRQSALFQADHIPVRTRYDTVSHDSGRFWRHAGKASWQAAQIKLLIKNQSPALGRAIPAGAVRVYQNAGDGGSVLLGEAQLRNTTVGEEISLGIGKAFDIKARRTQTDFEGSRRESESQWKVELRNGSDHPVEVRVVENLPDFWEILESSKPYTKADARRVHWTLSIPAKGKSELRYRIRVRQR